MTKNVQCYKNTERPELCYHSQGVYSVHCCQHTPEHTEDYFNEINLFGINYNIIITDFVQNRGFST